MDSSSESTSSCSLEEGMNGDVISHGLPLKLFAYISEVEKRSGVKLHARVAHQTNCTDVNNNHEPIGDEDMELFSRPRSKSGFNQVTSPLTQRRTVARPKSEYIPNGHYQIVDFNTATLHNGYHTDDDEIFHPLRVPEHHETIERYRKTSEPVWMDGLADNRNNNRLSSISTNPSSDEDEEFGWDVNYDKAQSDIGAMSLHHRSVEQVELLKKIEMLEKQNELLKQQLQSEKTSKDEGVQVQQHTKEPIQPIRLKQLAPLKFQQQLEDVEGIDSGVQIFHLFMDAERIYVNGLLTLVRQFFLPMKMFSACRPHVLPLLQLDGIFLNCEQLLLFHQSIFAAMLRIDQSLESHLISEFLNTFDKFLPGLTVYTPFIALGQQTFEEEYQSTVQNSEVSQLVSHCEENSGTVLKDLFMNIFQHYDHYKQLLVLFLRLPESNDPRESQVINMIDYLKALSKELAGSVCDWNVMTAKMKVLQSITDSSMLPMEIFRSDVHYIKKGNLLNVVNGNEFSSVCLLFTTHVALAHQTTDYRIEIVNPGMMALCGAILHERVDINGQPIQEDFITGDRQDQLGFKVVFHNKHSIYLRAKPNHLKDWLHHFNNAINCAHRNCSCKTRVDNSNTNTGIDLGPQAKIAAASLEKLFQQLTNPLNTNRDFLETFFMTYCLFTTAEDVLTALINCLLQKDDVNRNRYSDDWEVFSYHSSAAESDDEDADRPIINASPSMDTLDSFNSGSVTTFLSEQESPANSVYSSPVMSRKTLSPSASPRRRRKSDEGPGESSEDCKQQSESSDMFATARGTIKVKRRLSHDETDSDTTKQIVKAIRHRKSLTRAQSESNIDDPVSPSRRSRRLSTQSDSSTSSGLCQGAGGAERVTPPRMAVSPSKENVALSRPPQISRQQTTESSSRSFSTSSGHFADQESEGETLSPDPTCPTPRASIQMAVPINEDINNNDSVSDDDTTKNSIVTEMQEQFPLLRSTTSPLLSTLAQTNDMCRSLPNNLHRIGLERSSSEEYPSPRSERSYTVSGTSELKISNSLARRVADEGRILSEIYEDSAESRASTQSPSPPPYSDSRSRSDAFIEAGKLNITKLGVKKSSSFDRKVNNAQQLEQARDVSRLKAVAENGRRGSIFSRLLPSRKKRQSDSDVTPLQNNSLTQSLQFRPTSPVNVLTTSLPAHVKSSTSKTKSRFSVLRRRRDNNELMLSPTKDFSLSGGRLSPSPGARYGDPSSQLLQQRNIILSIYANLNYWLSQHKEDFLHSKSLKEKMMSSLESHMEKVGARDRQQLELAEETIQKLQEVTSDDSVIDKSITNMLLRTIQPEFGLGALGWVEMSERPMSNATIINLHHKQLSRQLMLLEYALYAAIERRELVGCCWKHKNKEKEAPNVCRVIKHSNKLTSWVMTAILQQETVQGRAAAIELFIRVASDCLKHNDAQNSVLITCALNSCCVRHDRLKLSWEQVPSKFRQKYDKLVKFSNPDRHCRAMRTHLEKQQAPGVPYTGGYLEHIWAIENVHKTYTTEGLVNFSKMTALCTAIRSFLCFQSEPYYFEPDFKLMHYIMAAERLDDEELYHLSKEREP